MMTLQIFSLLGFSFLVNQKKHLPLCVCPLWVSAILMIYLYIGAYLKYLDVFCSTALYVGLMAFIVYLYPALKEKKENKYLLAFFVFHLFFCFWYVAGMPFSVSDDYVYWGAASKYIYLKKHFLDATHTLYSRHETYTPGISLLHYFFLFKENTFKESMLYFASDWLLVSCFFTVLKDKKISHLNLFLLFSLLSALFFGSILAKLSVDYFLSIIGVCALWFCWHENNFDKQCLFIMPLLLCLFLIKQAGLFVAFFIFTNVFYRASEKNKKKKVYYGCIILILFFILKQSWGLYTKSQNFQSFSTFNLSTLMHVFCFWQDIEIKKAWFSFFKQVFFAKADRFNIPYLFWYGLFLVGFIFLLKNSNDEDKKKLRDFFYLSLSFFLLYVLALGFFEINTFFSLIKDESDFPSLARYLNLFFCTPLFFVLLLVAKKIAKTRPSLIKPSFVLLTSFFVIIFIGGHGKRLNEDFIRSNRAILEKVKQQYLVIKQDAVKTLCFNPEKYPSIRRYELIYVLLPSYKVKALNERKDFKTCQYLLDQKNNKVFVNGFISRTH